MKKPHAIHHIHCKCGDEFFVIAHHDQFIEASKVMDLLVKYITGDKNV